jgi:hypothetical protein
MPSHVVLASGTASADAAMNNAVVGNHDVGDRKCLPTPGQYPLQSCRRR